MAIIFIIAGSFVGLISAGVALAFLGASLPAALGLWCATGFAAVALGTLFGLLPGNTLSADGTANSAT